MPSGQECSQEVLYTIPLVMRAIRSEMRRERKPDLTVPQFRTLAFLRHYPGSSLSQVAEHVGLRLPSMSKLVDGLVERRLVARETSAGDRRRVTLAPTPAGTAVLLATENAAKARLATMLQRLSGREQNDVIHAMKILRTVFAGDGEARNGKEGAAPAARP